LFLSLALGASAILLILGLRTSLAGSAAAICTAGAALYGKHYLNLFWSGMDAWLFLFVIVFSCRAHSLCWVPAAIRSMRGSPAGE